MAHTYKRKEEGEKGKREEREEIYWFGLAFYLVWKSGNGYDGGGDMWEQLDYPAA